MDDTPRPGFFRRYGFRTPVRGHAFAAAPLGAETLTPGTTLQLVREPNNPRDPFAIAVWSSAASNDTASSWRIGYLDQLVAARLAPFLDDGGIITASFDGWVTEPEGRWQRPLIRLQIDAADELDDLDGELTIATDPDRFTSPPRLSKLGPGVRRRRISGQ
ncbi:MAG: HIRAN domain-containing protein [Nitriliruptoraceae bacterium]